jgi:hypothetical protein
MKIRKPLTLVTARLMEAPEFEVQSRTKMSRTWIVDVRGMKRSLRRLFLLGISLCDVPISTSCSTFANAHRLFSTYVVGRLLIFITLLILSGLGLIWSTLLVVQCLPSLAENLADLTC